MNDDGSLGERNTVAAGSIEHKMGIKGSATCVMNFDDAKGWMVGAENTGLASMFIMMNYERVTMGLQGLGGTELAYQNAAAYALERGQGRSDTQIQSPEKPADSIIHHADVRRMLLNARANAKRHVVCHVCCQAAVKPNMAPTPKQQKRLPSGCPTHPDRQSVFDGQSVRSYR